MKKTLALVIIIYSHVSFLNVRTTFFQSARGLEKTTRIKTAGGRINVQ